MINGDAIKEVADLAVAAAGKETAFAINDRYYSTIELHAIVPKDPAPAKLKVRTLSALVDYIVADPDGAGERETESLFVHIVSPEVVQLIVGIEKPETMQRMTFIEAVYTAPVWQASIYADETDEYGNSIRNRPTPRAGRGFELGVYMPLEAFIIGLRTQFVANEDRERLIDILGNITEEASLTLQDDGISQQVTARAGVARVANKPVPAESLLAPYRTFREVEQPRSPYVCRLRRNENAGTPGGRITAALFEASGSEWELAAIQSIKDWLTKELAGKNGGLVTILG